MLYHVIKLGKKHVRLPLYKSMYLGTKFDHIFMSVQETELDMIYLWTIQCEYKGITEQLICYVQSF